MREQGEKLLKSYTMVILWFCLNHHLFFQSLLDLEYVIKDRSFLESLFDTEFQETLPATCFFYKGRL